MPWPGCLSRLQCCLPYAIEWERALPPHSVREERVAVEAAKTLLSAKLVVDPDNEEANNNFKEGAVGVLDKLAMTAADKAVAGSKKKLEETVGEWKKEMESMLRTAVNGFKEELN